MFILLLFCLICLHTHFLSLHFSECTRVPLIPCLHCSLFCFKPFMCRSFFHLVVLNIGLQSCFLRHIPPHDSRSGPFDSLSFRKTCCGGLGSHHWSVQNLSAPITGIKDDWNHVAGYWIFFPSSLSILDITFLAEKNEMSKFYRWLQFMGKQNEPKINKLCQLSLRSLGSKFAERICYDSVCYFHFYCPHSLPIFILMLWQAYVHILLACKLWCCSNN